MILTGAERAKYVVRFLMKETGKTQAEIALDLGYNNTTVLSQILNGKKSVPQNFFTRLASLDPRINMEFLTGESEEMLNMPAEFAGTAPERPRTPSPEDFPARPGKASENGIFVPTELVQMISDLSATIKDQQDMIRALVDSWINYSKKDSNENR